MYPEMDIGSLATVALENAYLVLVAIGAAAVLAALGLILLKDEAKYFFEHVYDSVSGSTHRYRTQRSTVLPLRLAKVVTKWWAILGLASITIGERVARIGLDTVKDAVSG